MKTIIHVDQRVIRRNLKQGTCDPVLTVKTYKTTDRCHSVEIHGPSRLIYSPDKPLSCGARVWLETDAMVTQHDKPISNAKEQP